MSRINRVCNIECRRAITNEKDETEEELPLPLIHSIGYHEYTITNPQGNLFLDFENGTSREINFEKNTAGAFHLKLPCSATLQITVRQMNVTIIEKTIPCLAKENNKIRWMRILPAQWSLIPEGKILSSLYTPHTYTLEEQILNNDWKVPTSYIETEQEREKRLEEITLTKRTHIYGSQFIFKITTIGSLTCLALALIYIAYTLFKIKMEIQKINIAKNERENIELRELLRSRRTRREESRESNLI